MKRHRMVDVHLLLKKENNMSEEKQLNQVLGFWDLMAQAIGQIIGAGIMSLTGAAIALTGKSVPLAFIISTVVAILSVVLSPRLHYSKKQMISTSVDLNEAQIETWKG